MALIIPLQPIADNILEVTIEEKNLNIRTVWNSKEEAWRVDFRTKELDPILQGLKILPFVQLTRQYMDERLPDGVFVVQDVDGTGVRPTFDDLGGRIQLWYFTEAESSGFLP